MSGLPTAATWVMAGYVIGYQSTVGRIATRSIISGQESSDLSASTGGPWTTGSLTATNSRLLLRAFAAQPSSILLFHTYDTPAM